MNIALILAGGIGTRMESDIPKQYIVIKDKPIISYSIDVINDDTNIDFIQIVADEEWHEFICNSIDTKKLKGFSKVGQNRQLSILQGLEDIRKYASDEDLVFIHDAVRPMLSKEQISDCFRAIKGHDGVMPVLKMKDTVYFSSDGKRVSELVDRDKIYAGQAPELFKIGTYYSANTNLLPNKIFTINGSTEPAIMAGLDINMIPGDENNFKITTQNDLERFTKILNNKNC